MTFEPRRQPLDLRTRKRIAAMQHIQHVALDLFDAHGYESVTIAQIAQAADVGERSIYRYFGNKSMLVLHDEVDQQTIDTFTEHIDRHSLVVAVRATLDSIAHVLARDVSALALRKLNLVHQHPDLQAAVANYTEQLGDALGAVIAAARDRPADEFSARVQGRCIVTALAVAVDHWYRDPHRGALADELHNAIDSLTSLDNN